MMEIDSVVGKYLIQVIAPYLSRQEFTHQEAVLPRDRDSEYG